ncbi:hypothetical protein BYT27DRAFT_7225881 [Phlegmacium glaucopus]|nr:hypothetical protein BYT27DRAFT_7225881 [Phlegmacium glaucopus]
MDNAGWHAQRRAEKESAAHYRTQDVVPMDESYIGGLPRSPPPPALPPKDYPYKPSNYDRLQLQPSQPTITTPQLTHMTAVERSEALRVPRMEPHLQFMCGPLLKYDTVDEHGIWHGAAMIVTADSGSTYDPHPTLSYSWDPDQPVPPHRHRRMRSSMHRHSGDNQNNCESPTRSLHQVQPTASYELGPHPADPHSTVSPGSSLPTSNFVPSANGHETTNGTDNANGSWDEHRFGPSTCTERVPGQELWVYGGRGSTFTFWRFLIQVPLAQHEMAIRYSVNSGQQIEFWVPGRMQNMRWAAHSCNGFSAGVNPDDFRGPGFTSGYDPVWIDLLFKHAEQPFHALVGGGDQLYCDAIMREPEMQDWVSVSKPEDKKSYILTPEMELCIDRFFFSHYCQAFRRGAFARANCSIPMLNMCDDHDPDDLQKAPVFRQIGARGYFFFLLFQCFINVEIDGVQDLPGKHVFQSLIIGEPGPYVRYPSHSFLPRLGPQVYILLLDCRAERKKDQVCSPAQYQRVFDRLNNLPPGVEHVIVQTGIPIAYPRMVFLEAALESRFNPLVALGRSGSMGLSGFVNKFNAEAELLDDLNDHWTARSHKKERNWLIEQLQNFARLKHIRVSFLSGDVHCSAVGVLKTLKGKHKTEVSPLTDHRYMVNVVTSAIVNTPPPNGVITMVSSLATKVHRTLHGTDTDETMIPLFSKEPNGQPRKQKFIMGKRNWCSVDWNQSGELTFDIRVEIQKGYGVTVGYPLAVPRPGW